MTTRDWVTLAACKDEDPDLFFGPEEEEEPPWRQLALCAEVDSEIFFPERGGSTREAKKVCAKCEVRAECLEYALATHQRFGIWGGLSERERYRMEQAGVAA